MNDLKVVAGGEGFQKSKQRKESRWAKRKTDSGIQQNKSLKSNQRLKGCLKFDQILNGMFLRV